MKLTKGFYGYSSEFTNCMFVREIVFIDRVPDHGRADWLGCWDEFVQKAYLKKLVCLHHIKQNNLTYLGRVCLSVSTVIYDRVNSWEFSNNFDLRNEKLELKTVPSINHRSDKMHFDFMLKKLQFFAFTFSFRFFDISKWKKQHFWKIGLRFSNIIWIEMKCYSSLLTYKLILV